MKPRVCAIPPTCSSEAGDIAVDIAAAVGLMLDPWQQFCLRAICGEAREGKWSAFEAALMVGRQNGKGAILEARALAGVLAFGERRVWHTAHNLDTAEEAHERLVQRIEASDDLAALVRKVSHVNGRKAVVFTNGARIDYRSRDGRGGRGKSVDLLIVDEAMYTDSAMLGALIPTMGSRPNPQIVYAMSGLLWHSEMMRKLQAKVVAGDPPSALCWLEYSAPADADIRDEDAWVLANPSIPGRITKEFIRKELESGMDEEEFRREIMCVSDQPGGAQIIDSDLWDLGCDPASQPGEQVAFGLHVGADRKSATVAVASLRADGRTHVEVVASQAGASWVVDWLGDRAEAAPWSFPIQVLAGSGAAAHIPGLAGAGVPVTEVNSGGYRSSCARLLDLVRDGQLVHLGQPLLEAAVFGAREHRVGQAFEWSWKRSTEDIGPLVAVTLALAGLAGNELSVERKTSAPLVVEDHGAVLVGAGDLAW